MRTITVRCRCRSTPTIWRPSYRSLTGASFVVEVSTPRVTRDVTGSGGPAPSSHQFSPAVDTCVRGDDRGKADAILVYEGGRSRARGRPHQRGGDADVRR